MAETSGELRLPPGVQAVASRETTESNAVGQIVQGQLVTFRLPSGTQTTLFIGYDEMHDLPAVAARVAERVAHVERIVRSGRNEVR